MVEQGQQSCRRFKAVECSDYDRHVEMVARFGGDFFSACVDVVGICAALEHTCYRSHRDYVYMQKSG